MKQIMPFIPNPNEYLQVKLNNFMYYYMLVSGAIAYAILMWLGFKMCCYVGVSLTGKGLGNNKAKAIEMNKQLMKTLIVQVHFFRKSV